MKKIFLIQFILFNTFLINKVWANQSKDFALLNLKYFSLANEADLKINEKKIIKSAFFPEVFLNTGMGNTKTFQEAEIERGPYLYLESELNLYRGGKDINQLKIIDREIQNIEWKKIIEERDLSINTFEILTKIQTLSAIEKLIREEIVKNKDHEEMAKKKVNAGLSSSLDLIDFQLKSEALSNQLEDNQLKLLELENKLKSLYGKNEEKIDEIKKNLNTFEENSLETNSYSSEKIPQLLIEQNNISIAELEKNNSIAEYMPTVALNAKWGQLTPFDKILDRKLEYSIMLNINFPLFSGFSSSAKYQQMVINLSQKSRENHQSTIEYDISKDLTLKRITSLKRKISYLESSLKKSKEYLKRTMDEYKRGVKNSPDVIVASDKVFSISTETEETKTELKNNIYTYNLIYKPL